MLQASIRSTALLTAVILIASLAGCLAQSDAEEAPSSSRDGTPSNSNQGSSDPSPEPAPEPKPNKKRGAVTGEVVTSEFDALPNAQARLYNQTGTLANATTDSDGKYTINEVVPGRYQIEFTATCCQAAIQSVEVETEKTAKANAVLEVRNTTKDPYISEYEWSGSVSCRVELLFADVDRDECEEVSENHDTQHEFEVDRGIRSLVIGMEWDTGINLRECHLLGVLVPQSNDHPDYDGAGHPIHESEGCETSPIEIRMDARITYYWSEDFGQHIDFSNVTDYLPLAFKVDADSSSLGQVPPRINLVYQQPFTVYWKEHYWEHAPEDASALPQ